jgi:hypothetical protein
VKYVSPSVSVFLVRRGDLGEEHVPLQMWADEPAVFVRGLGTVPPQPWFDTGFYTDGAGSYGAALDMFVPFTTGAWTLPC